jgi:stress-induced morphogen
MSSEEGTSVDAISAAFRSKVDCKHLFIQDMSNCGCGQKFTLYAVSSAFVGLPLIKRHQLAHEVLHDEIAKLHAITLKLWTEDDWEKKKGQVPEDLKDLIE